MLKTKLTVAALFALSAAAVSHAMTLTCERTYLAAGETTVCTAALSTQGASGSIQFQIDNSQTFYGTLDNEGRASFTTPADLSSGTHQIEAGFYGGPSNGQYHPPENAYLDITVQ